MFDLTALMPYVVSFLVFGVAAAGLAVATLAKLAVEARGPKSRPVVLITTERTASRVAA